MALTSSVSLTITTNETNPLDLCTPTSKTSITYSDSLTSGIDRDQADTTFSDTRTVTTGSNDDVDLSGGIIGSFNNTPVLQGIKSIYIKNRSAVCTLVIGAAASNAWEGWTSEMGSTVKIVPGGVIWLYGGPDIDGYAVVPGSADILRVHNSGAESASYDIVVIGISDNSST